MSLSYFYIHTIYVCIYIHTCIHIYMSKVYDCQNN